MAVLPVILPVNDPAVHSRVRRLIGEDKADNWIDDEVRAAITDNTLCAVCGGLWQSYWLTVPTCDLYGAAADLLELDLPRLRRKVDVADKDAQRKSSQESDRNGAAD